MRRIKTLLPNNQLIQDMNIDVDVPSFPFKENRHSKGMGLRDDGAYERTFHDILDGNARRGITGLLPANPNAQQIRIAIKATYEELEARYGDIDDIDYLAMGKIVDEFLISRGVP